MRACKGPNVAQNGGDWNPRLYGKPRPTGSSAPCRAFSPLQGWSSDQLRRHRATP